MEMVGWEVRELAGSSQSTPCYQDESRVKARGKDASGAHAVSEEKGAK